MKKEQESMNDQEIQERSGSFAETLSSARRSGPLYEDFVRRFNEFVAEYPHALESSKNSSGKTLLAALFGYLCRAINRKHKLATFQALVIQTPQVLAEVDGYGWTLLHHVCMHNPNALDIICFFVERFPDATKMKSAGENTPLHFACANKAPLPVLRVLVPANPRAVYSRDHDGNAPLHDACGNGASLDAIQYLVMQEPSICLNQSRNGMIPVDEANKAERRNQGIVEFLTTETNAAANVLMERLCFAGPPLETFERIATFVDGRVPVKVSVVQLALSTGEMAVLYRRSQVREDFDAQIQAE